MERDPFNVALKNSVTDFNSHAHVERDSFDTLSKIVSIISTHTLTWSVTSAPFVRSHAFRISTHTLTWSVTLFHVVKTNLRRDFNSHAHVERDFANFKSTS